MSISASGNKNQIFVLTVQLITAFLIAESFREISPVFIPLSNLLNIHYLVDALGIILAYFVVISGWIGYHRSISCREHFGILGLLRFIIDFFTLFFVFYLIRISVPNSQDEYGMTFVWVIPAMFTLYSIWDIIKMFEYRNQGDLLVNPSRVQLTWVFCIIFFILALIYSLLLGQYAELKITFWEKKSSIDIVFIVICFILISLYRWKKRSLKDKDFKAINSYKAG